jgi:hypothetical protein
LNSYPSAVAFQNGRMFGFSYCFRFAPDIVELANIYIDSKSRQAGAGSRMIDFLVSQLAPEINAIIAVNSDLYPVTGEKRRPDSFYVRNGFRIVASTTSSVVYWWQKA